MGETGNWKLETGKGEKLFIELLIPSLGSLEKLRVHVYP